MRLQLHLTDANPKISGATFPYVIQEVLGFEYQYSDTPISFARQLREASTGDPVRVMPTAACRAGAAISMKRLHLALHPFAAMRQFGSDRR